MLRRTLGRGHNGSLCAIATSADRPFKTPIHSSSSSAASTMGPAGHDRRREEAQDVLAPPLRRRRKRCGMANGELDRWGCELEPHGAGEALLA
jgi:hypothetical protein